MGKKERLDKMLALHDPSRSRRDVKELVRKGLVAVNGQTVRTPDWKISEEDEVVVCGKPLVLRRHLYLMLNKPAGFVCSTRDRDCRTVLELVPAPWRRQGLFPAGRLDKDTEGFVLLTDDGAFAHRILAPKHHVPKTYYVELDRAFDAQALAAAFAQGLVLDGGDTTSAAQLTLLRGGNAPQAQLVIYEGLYHQVKRMFLLFGIHVTYLRRTHIGGLALDPNLPLGVCREILHKEIVLI